MISVSPCRSTGQKQDKTDRVVRYGQRHRMSSLFLLLLLLLLLLFAYTKRNSKKMFIELNECLTFSLQLIWLSLLFGGGPSVSFLNVIRLFSRKGWARFSQTPRTSPLSHIGTESICQPAVATLAVLPKKNTKKTHTNRRKQDGQLTGRYSNERGNEPQRWMNKTASWFPPKLMNDESFTWM